MNEDSIAFVIAFFCGWFCHWLFEGKRGGKQ